MVITPVKSYSFQFTSDGTSTSLVVDASLAPIAEDFTGASPLAVLLPTATSTATGALAGITASISGTTVTFTFSTPPQKNDGNGNLIVYTGTFLLQYGT